MMLLLLLLMMMMMMTVIGYRNEIEKFIVLTQDVFVLDTAGKCFVWVGNGASANEKKNGFAYAHVSCQQLCVFRADLEGLRRRGGGLSRLEMMLYSLTLTVNSVAQKLAQFLYALTLPNIDRFSKLFHFQNQEKICNNTLTKDPTAPQMCRCTTLWNVKCLNSNNWKQDDVRS